MLNTELDRVKVQLFIGSNSAFYGSLLCSMDVSFCEKVSTATVNNKMEIKWNPDWFKKLPEPTRKTVLIHEIEHVARLHFLRMGMRDPDIWNQACDHEINLGLEDDGYTFFGTMPLKDPSFRGMTAEQIYDILVSEPNKQSSQGAFGEGGEGCIQHEPNEPDDSGESQSTLEQDLSKMLNEVIKADQMAKQSDSYSTSRRNASEQVLDKFLKSKMKWNVFLRKYFNEKLHTALNWKRSNRRYQDIYLPSRKKVDGKLSHVIFYLDTSGSVSDEMITRFFSEVKHVKDAYNPDKITIVQFDTDIHSDVTYTSHQRIKSTKVIGRGGTCLRCVHDHITKRKPTIAVILSDLECAIMPIAPRVDIIWICMGNPSATVAQGKLVHVEG